MIVDSKTNKVCFQVAPVGDRFRLDENGSQRGRHALRLLVALTNPRSNAANGVVPKVAAISRDNEHTY